MYFCVNLLKVNYTEIIREKLKFKYRLKSVFTKSIKE